MATIRGRRLCEYYTPRDMLRAESLSVPPGLMPVQRRSIAAAMLLDTLTKSLQGFASTAWADASTAAVPSCSSVFEQRRRKDSILPGLFGRERLHALATKTRCA